MANLEGTEAAFSFSSGMAAMHAVFTTLAASGDRIVSSNELYGGAYSLFTKVMPRYGVTVDLVDPHDLDAVAAALPGAAFFYVETIANPNVTVADLEALGALCRAQGVPAVVDNTFASPYLANPSRWGFEYVVHSATKFIGGHNDLIGGVVCTSHGRLRGAPRDRDRHRRHDGAVRGVALHARPGDARAPDGAPLRERVAHGGVPGDPPQGRARRVPGAGLAPAARRRANASLPRGSGGIIALEVAGGVEGGKRFCDSLDLAWVATSLGGAHTLVGHAASTTHRQMDPEARRRAGIADGLVRVSIGLEDVDDLIEDFDRALEKV